MAATEAAPPDASLAVIAGQPLLALLPPAVADLVLASFQPLRFAFGDIIVREGDVPDGFYVVAEGMARVVRGEGEREVSLGLLRAGDSFGEMALLDGAPRSATVRAMAETEVHRLDQSVAAALLRMHPELRDAVAAQARTREVAALLRLRMPFSALPAAAVTELMRRGLDEVEVQPGETAVREGEPGDSAYLIEAGRFQALQGDGDAATAVGYLRAGEVFGERALFLGEPRAATVVALEPGRLIRIGSDTFRWLLSDYPDFRDRVEERVGVYRGSAAALPLDFHDVLPADASEAVRVEALVNEAPELPPAGVESLEAAGVRATAPPRRIRAKFPMVRQLDQMDCGAACVAMVCRHFGRDVSISHIRQAVGTHVDGTSLRGIQRGGEFVGLDVRAIKTSIDRLDALPVPAIVHWGGNHWVVIYAVERDHVRIADPARGRRRVRREELAKDWSGYAALPTATPRLAEAPLGLRNASWFWPFVRPHLLTLAVGFVLAILGAGIAMLLPVVSQRIVDNLLIEQSRQRLNVLAAGMFGLLVLSLGIGFAQARLLSLVAMRVDAKSLDFISERMLRLPMSYFESRRTGDLERRIDGLRSVRAVVVGSSIQALTAVTQLVAAMVFMFLYSWVVGLIYLATVPFFLALMRTSARRLRPTFERLEEAYGRFRSRQIDSLKGIETVKAHGAEDEARRQLVTQFTELAERGYRADFGAMTYWSVVSLATFATSLLILWVCAIQVLEGNLTVGQLVSINSLVLLAMGPQLGLMGLWDEVQIISVLIGRVHDILEQEPEQGHERDRLRPVPSLEGRVTLDGVGFHYATAPSTPILQDVTIDIPPGSRVALVGRSGSGKSTLLRCLAGMVGITEGSIRYDGVRLEELRFQDLRRKVGFVLQAPYLFDDTIARNIAFGDETPDMERVRQAAEIANAAEFISRLPLAYETRVGESGMRVSGGQAQRIAIARAVYNRPPILLFDEATSALDTEAERAVKENLDRLLEGRTAFITAHRLSTIRDADVIMVLESGRLVESGRHEDLMRKQGLYYHLVGQQLEG